MACQTSEATWLVLLKAASKKSLRSWDPSCCTSSAFPVRFRSISPISSTFPIPPAAFSLRFPVRNEKAKQ